MIWKSYLIQSWHLQLGDGKGGLLEKVIGLLECDRNLLLSFLCLDPQIPQNIFLIKYN